VVTRPGLTAVLLAGASICAPWVPAGRVSAQATSARAYVAPAGQVAVGRMFVLNVEITGAQSVDREPELPDVSSFAQYLGSNTQSSMNMVNGRTTVSLTLQYRYQAVTEGTFRIPAFMVEAVGRTFTTEPIEVSVSAAVPGEPDPATGLAATDLFITAEASASSVREGQPFLVEYRIWTRVDVTNFGVTNVPEPEGFWVEDLTPSGQPEVEQRLRDGVQYATALVRRVALVPTGAGRRTIDPIGIEAQVRVRRGRDSLQDFFGRSSLFGTTTVQTTVASDPLTVEVRPLPTPRPEGFSGLVGSLGVTATLDRDSVDANEAVTLTIDVRGDGNVRAIPAPELTLPPDFEVFPPEVTERVRPTGEGLAGSKTFEYVLIPRAPGRREIPSIDVVYFDRAAEAYRTATGGALQLVVSGEVVDGPGAVTRGGVAQLREDIRFIRLGSLELRRTAGGPVFVGVSFWLLLLLPMAAVAGAVVLRRHQDLLAGDVAYARGRKAGRVARKRLAEARRLSDGDDPRAFYAEVARAVRGLVADRLNLAEAGLQTTEVGSALASKGIDEDVRDRVLQCLEHCDRQRFAPPADDAEERSRFLGGVTELMTALDRGMR
jgi:hypothetical protein